MGYRHVTAYLSTRSGRGNEHHLYDDTVPQRHAANTTQRPLFATIPATVTGDIKTNLDGGPPGGWHVLRTP